ALFEIFAEVVDAVLHLDDQIRDAGLRHGRLSGERWTGGEQQHRNESPRACRHRPHDRSLKDPVDVTSHVARRSKTLAFRNDGNLRPAESEVVHNSKKNAGNRAEVTVEAECRAVRLINRPRYDVGGAVAL